MKDITKTMLDITHLTMSLHMQDLYAHKRKVHIIAKSELVSTIAQVVRESSLLTCVINPRRACAARVTVVGSVCLLSHISPMERLFVLKTLSRTQRATKVKIFVGFSLKPLRCRDPALPPLCGRAVDHFSC